MADTTENSVADRLDRGGGHYIAYHRLQGKAPGVVFVHGLRSDMNGGKALHLEEQCRKAGRAFVRFDCHGHGASSGDFVHGTLTRWVDDLLAVLDRVCEGPQIVVGSSMGGWVMLRGAVERPDRVAGCLGIAAAPDFTENLLWEELTPAQRDLLIEQGFVDLPNCHDPDTPFRIGRPLVEDGRDNLMLSWPIPIRCPVRLIHGLKDDDVPWRTSQTLMDKIESPDVEVTFVKEGDHRLSEPRDLDRLSGVLDGLIRRVETMA